MSNDTGNRKLAIWNQRQRVVLREILELARQLARDERMPNGEKVFSDWKDADDWLFSELNLTTGDLAEIYDPADKKVMPYTGSAISGIAPAGLSYKELRAFVGMDLLCEARICANGSETAVICLDVPGYPVLFTSGDAAALTGAVGHKVTLGTVETQTGKEHIVLVDNVDAANKVLCVVFDPADEEMCMDIAQAIENIKRQI